MDRTQLGAALATLLFLASPAAADIAVVAVDNHTVNVNGVTGPAKNPPSDHVAIVAAEEAWLRAEGVEINN